MLNRSQSICLSFMMLAAAETHAAARGGRIVSRPRDEGRAHIAFKICSMQQTPPVGTSSVAMSSHDSGPIEQFNLSEVVGGTPLIDTHAQYPSWFWRSFGIAVGLSAASIAGGLHFNYTPEQVARFTTRVSLAEIAYGIGAQLYRLVGYNTSIISTIADHSPGLKALVQEETRELRVSRADQMWQLLHKLRQAKERGLIGSAEAAYNEKLLPVALLKILTDMDDPYLKNLLDRVALNVQRRNCSSMLGYISGGVVGLMLARSLKGVARN